ncbi:MAG TPA: alpha/beta fold hydrolase [Polyangiaceae bacterium]|nr:alpha/beta fold hydrolase [Polyangiaceae bacterium]
MPSPAPTLAVATAPRVAAPRRWVLLRGLGRDGRHWFDFPHRFARELGAPCLLLDLPGTGELVSGPAPASVEGHARQLDRQLDRQLAVGNEASKWGPIGVLAVSFGSMVAFAWAARRPDRISHLVSINSSSRDSRPYRRLRPRAARQLLSAALLPPLTRERCIYALTTHGPPQACEAWALQAAEFARARPIKPMTLLRQLLAAAGFSLPELAAPCLILSSQRDRLVSPACSEAIARRLGAPHLSHPWAGHDLPLDDPDWVIARVRCWLSHAPCVSGAAAAP